MLLSFTFTRELFRRFKMSSSIPFRFPYSLKWIGPVKPSILTYFFSKETIVRQRKKQGNKICTEKVCWRAEILRIVSCMSIYVFHSTNMHKTLTAYNHIGIFKDCQHCTGGSEVTYSCNLLCYLTKLRFYLSLLY